MNIFLWKDGSEVGPFGLAELSAQVNSGKTSPQALARYEGSANWKPLESILPKAQTKVEAAAKTAPKKSAPKATNPRANRFALSYALAIVGLVLIAFGATKFTPSDDSLESLNRRLAEDANSRASAVEHFAKFEEAIGSKGGEREAAADSQRNRDSAQSWKAEADALEANRKLAAYFALGLGILILVTGMILRAV